MSKIINWGILGPGKIAKKFALGLSYVPNANLYAAASRSLEKAKDFSAEMGADKAYGSYTEMLNDPKVDAIYIATPHVFHYEHTLLCLKHKKHVLCEKPFAMNKDQVKEMIDFAQKQDTFLMEAMWTHFLPHFKYTKEVIKSGKYGKVLAMEADFGFDAPFNANSRIYNKSLGGGSLLDIGIYPIFAALNFLGKPEKIEATAKMTKTEVGLDHTGGMSSILIPFALLWFFGFSYFVVAIPALVWVWMSMSWPNLELPPFRLGVWHGTGIAFTAFVGVVVAFQMVQ